MKTVGKWLYLIGMLVAIVGALADFSNEWVTYLLMLAAILAGIFYKDPDEVKGFAIRYLGLAAVAGVLGDFLDPVGPFLTDIFTAAVWFMGPVLLTTLVVYFIKKEF